MERFDIKSKIHQISEDYFSYLARNYPIMCLSDEFYFFPRVKKALDYLDVFDELSEEKIKESIYYIKGLKASLDNLSSVDMSLDARIDHSLLTQSVSTFIREFGQIKIWQIDPSLYLKICLLGIDQILNRFSFLIPEKYSFIRKRLEKIPHLLRQAEYNLKRIPESYLEVALEMIDASVDYFKHIALPIREGGLIDSALHSLYSFKRAISKKGSQSSFIKDRKLIEDILKYSFSYDRTLEDIFDIAFREYKNTIAELEKVARGVDTKKTWQEIISEYSIDIKDENKLLDLYSAQIGKLKSFIRDRDVITIKEIQDIKVKFTPGFMRPIRASASYCSPITEDAREPAHFYITRDFLASKRSNIHNEYIFVTSHETYPGHHLLDSVRRHISNPIRQQIESPLFYEGWASYAERLIDELGYIREPAIRLVGFKREAWRAARAMLDVGIRINRLKFEEAEGLLRSLGYKPKIAKFMFRHYALSPGYQLCYTIGKFEIDRLRKRFSSRLGLKKFHDLFLESGEIPFKLIERRLACFL